MIAQFILHLLPVLLLKSGILLCLFRALYLIILWNIQTPD